MVKEGVCPVEGERRRSKVIVSLGTWQGSEVSRDVEAGRPQECDTTPRPRRGPSRCQGPEFQGGPVFIVRAKISSHSLGEQSQSRKASRWVSTGHPSIPLSFQKAQVVMWWPRAQPQGNLPGR